MIPKLTAAGKNLLLRALTGEQITFTKIQLGNGPEQNPAEATHLENPILTVALSGITAGENYVTLTASFTNASVTSGFHITEAGFYAEDPDDNSREILYALGNEDESTADYVPDNANRILEMQFDAFIFVGDAENVSAAISSSLVYASKTEFDEHTENRGNPHGVTKTQVGLGNVPNVATNDQTPTFTEAPTLANINSGERLGSIFGKIKCAITNLTSHLSNKSNPHGVTADQAGAAKKSHTHNATDINAGTVGVQRGGTGLSGVTYGALLTGAGGTTALRPLLGTGALHATISGSPQFGVLPVICGGTGTTSLASLATSLASNGLAKTVIGTYTGNGATGSTNKRSLTFTSQPKLLVVMPADNTSNGQYGGFIVLRGVTSSRGGGIVDDVTGAQFQLYYTWDGNTVSWYGSNDFAMQNMNGKTYVYFAIL